MPHKILKNGESREYAFGDFRGGGLNLAASEHLLSPQDIKDGKNFCYERNGGRIRTLEPFKPVLEAPEDITGLYSSLNYGVFFTTAGHGLFRAADGEAVSIGELNGGDIPVMCDWGEEDEKRLYIASGSIIQWYDGSALHTQTPAPVDRNNPGGDKWNTANDVLVREGRLLVARAGRDRLVFSGVGDPENWQSETAGDDVHTDADSQWLEAGYKEGGNIVRIMPIDRDLVIFRSDGNLYRLFSSFPEWTVIKVNSQVQPVSRDAIAAVGNDIFFLDRDRGFRKVSAVHELDELAVTEEEGVRVNAWLAAHITGDARIWSLPDRGEIWARPSAGNIVLVWSSRYGGWTKIDMGSPVTAVCEHDGRVYAALGRNLYELTDERNADCDCLLPEMEIEFAPIFSRDRRMTDYQEIRAQMDTGAAATVDFGTWSFPVERPHTVRHQIFAADVLRPKLRSSGGTVVLDTFRLLSAEVV